MAFILLGPYLEPVSFSPFHNTLCQDIESSSGPAPVSTCQEVALKWLHPLPLPHWHVAPIASESSQSYLFQASNLNLCLASKPVNFHFMNMTFSKIPLLNHIVYFNLIGWLNLSQHEVQDDKQLTRHVLAMSLMTYHIIFYFNSNYLFNIYLNYSRI